ncbi:Pvc16 family protein [Streptomyces sp. NBC_01619]|uniref:Pvc16 family protein n=1 Tax=Streptomyces sp. NBC_01619 TaxID=2975901 RepID=UPI002257AB5B|nr:Pvc16 family protein [Streptomyces sp. NBC_01619]MCX4510848.1 Pvc16 family protein [Streptomyces sp. NBC_01619]
MSNALAFATVTQALALLIESNLSPEMDIAVKVETRRPPAEPPTEPTINVFLYQVTPNPSMRHTDLPTRAADGTLVKRPAAALDLHYLISAYGEEAKLVGQRLIGCVVRTLHEIPVLPRELIELAAERPYLAGSDLAQSPQKVRFTPTVMDVDETSKLWGMLHQTPYSLSVAYQASLVLIEGREKPVPAKPVETRTVRVLPFGAPGAPVPPGTDNPGADEPSTDVPASDEAGTEAPAGGAEPDPASSEPAPARKRAATKRSAPARTRKATGKPSGRAPGGKSDADNGADADGKER